MPEMEKADSRAVFRAAGIVPPDQTAAVLRVLETSMVLEASTSENAIEPEAFRS